MNKGKRIFFKLLIILKRMFQSIALILLLVLVLFLLLNSTQFLSWSKSRIIGLIKDQIENRVEYETLEFNFFRGTEISKLVLYDHHNDTLLYAEKLNIGLGRSLFSLLKNRLIFNDLDIHQAEIFLTTYQGEDENSVNVFLQQFKKKSNNQPLKFDFKVKNIEVEGLHYINVNYNTHNREELNLESLIMEIRAMDLRSGFVQIEDAKLIRPEYSIQKETVVKSEIIKPIEFCNDSLCVDPLIINCNHLTVEDGFLMMNQKNSSGTFDSISNIAFNPKHFYLSNANIELNELFIEGRQFNLGNLQSSAKINNFLDVHSIQSKRLSIIDNRLILPQFKLLTETSRLGDSLVLDLGSAFYTESSKENIFIDLFLRDSKISCRDLLFFIPTLTKNNFLVSHPELNAELAGQFVGRLNSLKGFDVFIDIANRLEFQGNIFTRNITKRGEELLNIKIKHLLSSSTFIQSLIPGLQKVKSLDKIGQFKYSGQFDGYFEDFVSYGVFVSDLGVVKSDLRLNLRPGVERALWSGNLDFERFEIGQLLKLDKLGTISLHADIRDGRGLSFENMYAEVNARVSELIYNSYPYQNLILDAKINKDLFDGEAHIADKNINLNFKGVLSDLSSIPKLKFVADISKLDLKSIKLSERAYIVSGSIETDILDLNPDKLNGQLILRNGLIYDYEKNHVLNVGNVEVSQIVKDSYAKTKIQSSIIDLDIDGQYKFKSLYHQAMTFVHKNYPEIFSDLNFKFVENNEPLNIHCQYKINGISRVASFFDIGLRSEEVSGIIDMDSDERTLRANVKSDNIKVNKLNLSQFSGELKGVGSLMNGQIKISSTQFNDQKLLGQVVLAQDYANGKMKFNLLAKDSIDTKDLYRLQMGSVKSNQFKKFFLEGDDILINGMKWKYSEGSSFEIARNYLAISDFEIFDSTSEIRLSDINQKGLRIEINSFDLAIINPILKSNSLTFTGLYDLDLNIKNIFSNEGMWGNLSLLNMRINKIAYGRFGIGFKMLDPRKPMELNVSNNYKETNINLSGWINIPLVSDYAMPKYDFDLKGSTAGFPLYFLESFISSISQTQGTLNGPIRIYRSNRKVYIDGEVVALNASTKVNYLNTKYFFDQQKIIFDGDRINFYSNIIYDELKNPIVANGQIFHKNLTYFTIGMELQSPKALVLNTTKEHNIYYYGYGIMSFKCRFEGLTSKLEMDFTGKSEKGTKFVIPVRYDQESKDTKFVTFKSKDTTTVIVQSTPILIKGMNIRMDVEVTEDCEMSIIFDEKNGDILRGNGSGNLQVASLRDGTFTINGNYTINDGQYLFTLLNFVNKPFKLKKGGTIIWTGDPLNANINIDAAFEDLSVNPSTLIEEYLSSNPNLEQYKQEAKLKTKVDLAMNMTGSLLKPDIKFKIGFPELTGTLKNLTDTKVRTLEQNTEQMNQQVASLILFKTFITTNSTLTPLKGVQSTGLNTISEFLSNQLSIFVTNILSEAYGNSNFVSGVDFNFNYDANKTLLGQDQSNASEFVFNVKHRILNDEWAISIGANVGNNAAFAQTNYFNPESVIEWNTPVPGLKMRIYYRGVTGIDGTRHRVGTGVSYRKEFNSFKDFKKAIKDQRSNDGTKFGSQ